MRLEKTEYNLKNHYKEIWGKDKVTILEELEYITVILNGCDYHNGYDNVKDCENRLNNIVYFLKNGHNINDDIIDLYEEILV